MNENIEHLDDDSLLVHFNLCDKREKTIRIDASERTRCEVWSRVMGYFRPIDSFNIGKKQEFKDRVPFKVEGWEPISNQVDRVTVYFNDYKEDKLQEKDINHGESRGTRGIKEEKKVLIPILTFLILNLFFMYSPPCSQCPPWLNSLSMSSVVLTKEDVLPAALPVLSLSKGVKISCL